MSPFIKLISCAAPGDNFTKERLEQWYSHHVIEVGQSFSVSRQELVHFQNIESLLDERRNMAFQRLADKIKSMKIAVHDREDMGTSVDERIRIFMVRP